MCLARSRPTVVTEDKSVIDFPMDGAPFRWVASTTIILAQLFSEPDAGAGAVHTISSGIMCFRPGDANGDGQALPLQGEARFRTDAGAGRPSGGSAVEPAAVCH